MKLLKIITHLSKPSDSLMNNIKRKPIVLMVMLGDCRATSINIQVVLDIYHPHIGLFLDVCQVFICFRFSRYKFIDLETYFRIWNTYKIGTYQGIRKTRVIYIEDYLYTKLYPS